MDMAIKVLITDQERTFAEALAARLDTEEDIEVVAAVQVRTPGPWLFAATSADVIVVDGDLPDGAANRLCAEASDRAGVSRIVTLSSSSEPKRIVDAIRAGAAAWVRKDQSLQDLLRVIRGVARGETWLLPPARQVRSCGCCCKSRIGAVNTGVWSPPSHPASGPSFPAWPKGPGTVTR